MCFINWLAFLNLSSNVVWGLPLQSLGGDGIYLSFLGLASSFHLKPFDSFYRRSRREGGYLTDTWQQP